MPVDTILTITKTNMTSLGPEQGVFYFRQLLWVEGRTSGLPITTINVPGDINDPDGGIDAEVQNAPTVSGQGIIKKGLTCYQIKTGKTNPTTDSQIKKILFKKKKSSKEPFELKPDVKRCLDNHGTFVLVHFGWDGPNNKIKTTTQKIQKELRTYNTKYKSAKIDFFPQNMLLGFFSQYPSLALALNEKASALFQTHVSWSKDEEMQKPFVLGLEHDKQIASIRKELRKNDTPVHIHIVGEPGIGKTRLVLEATKDDDIKPLVIYCDGANSILGSQLLNELLKDDNNCHAILVVDECEDQHRATLWNKLKFRSPRIKLVSIYNESKGLSELTFIESPLLTRDEIKEIIQNYGVPDFEAGRWAELCGNSPRVAHVVGKNLKNNPDDVLKTPSTVEVWDKFIAAGDHPSSPQVADRRLVLQHIALFKRFGYGKPLDEEAKAISIFIKDGNPQITWPKFQQMVSELKARKLLQGSTTLYISPKLLHIKLWTDWWNIYGPNFDLDDFSSKFSQHIKLLDWFLEMFEYAQESHAATKLVKQLLGPDGPFKDITVFEVKRAAFFFNALAEASPVEALKCLQRTVGNSSNEQLLNFSDGRREVIYALEHIVFYKEMFLDGARLLLRLAESENETWGNNASGVFANLFSPGIEKNASTSASPIERLPALIEALDSDSQAIRTVALDACDHALEAEYFTRFGRHEIAGLKKAPDGWTPKTYDELWEGYRNVWKILEERLATFQENDRITAVSIMLKRSRGLFRRTKLQDMVIPSLEEIVAKGYSNKKEVIKTLVEVIHYDGKDLPIELLEKLEQFKERLEGTGYSSQLQRYVGMDLLEDDYDDSGQRVERTQQIMRELAKQSVINTEQFYLELEWLVTAEASNGLLFGYELGLTDTSFHLLPDLLEAQRYAQDNSSPFFLCGYFRALFERDKSRWENELETVACDSILQTFVPEITWRSGALTDKVALIVLNLIEEGIIGYETLRMFSYGSAIREMSDDVFSKWMGLLIQKNEQASISIGLDLHNFFYCRKESKYELPEEVTLSLLTHPTFFTQSKNRRGSMEDYNWSNTCLCFVKKFPDKGLKLAEVMLEHFHQEGTIIDDAYGSPIEVLNEIVKNFPEQAWELIKKYLGPPIDIRAYHIKDWLRGDEHSRRKGGIKGGVIELIPPKKLWEWVDDNVSERAHYLTSMVPKALFNEKGRTCLAREVLVRYGDQEDVRHALIANFSTETWSGPESSHLEGKKKWLLEFLASEHNKNVRRWIDEYLHVLDKSIQRALIAEERGLF